MCPRTEYPCSFSRARNDSVTLQHNPCELASVPNEMSHCGYLKCRQGETGEKWMIDHSKKRRLTRTLFFSKTGDRPLLTYRASREDDRVKGVIPLLGSKIEVVESADTPHAFRIVCSGGSRRIVLIASNEIDRLTWMSALTLRDRPSIEFNADNQEHKGPTLKMLAEAAKRYRKIQYEFLFHISLVTGTQSHFPRVTTVRSADIKPPVPPPPRLENEAPVGIREMSSPSILPPALPQSFQHQSGDHSDRNTIMTGTTLENSGVSSGPECD